MVFIFAQESLQVQILKEIKFLYKDLHQRYIILPMSSIHCREEAESKSL